MKLRTAVLLGAGVVALGLAGVHVASAGSEPGNARGDRDGGHFVKDGPGWRHGRHADRANYRHWRRHARGMMHERFATLFDLLDVNADNGISREEAMRAPSQRFARLDGDKSGFASAEEIRRAVEAEPGRFERRLLERLDVDDDGQVSKAEFEVGARARFTRADANDNGVVTFQEFAAAGRAMRKHFVRRAADDAPRAAPAGGAATGTGDVEEPAASE